MREPILKRGRGRPKGSKGIRARSEAVHREAEMLQAVAPAPKTHFIAKADRVGLPSPREKHVPTEELRRRVANMASYGLTGAQVADLAEISLSTLYKHYSKEMRQAGLNKDLAVLQSAFLKAVGGPEQNWEKADAAQQRWWIEVRQRWRKPPEQHINANIDLSRLTDEQLDALERLLEHASFAGSGAGGEGEEEREAG